MLDFGWPELFVIIVLVVLFVGPEELPRVMVALGRVARRLQYIRYTISQSHSRRTGYSSKRKKIRQYQI